MSECAASSNELSQQQPAAANENPNDLTTASISSQAYVVYTAWAREKEQQMREQAAKLLQIMLPKICRDRKLRISAKNCVRIRRYFAENRRRSAESFARALRMIAEIRQINSERRQRWLRYAQRKEEAKLRRDRKGIRRHQNFNYLGAYDPLGAAGRQRIELRRWGRNYRCADPQCWCARWFSGAHEKIDTDSHGCDDESEDGVVPVLDLFVGTV